MVVGSRMIVAAWLLLARASAYVTIKYGESDLKALPWKHKVKCVGGDLKPYLIRPLTRSLDDVLNLCANACILQSDCEAAQLFVGSSNYECRTSTKKCTSVDDDTSIFGDRRYVMENLKASWEVNRRCTGTQIKSLIYEYTHTTLENAQKQCYALCIADGSCQYAQLEYYMTSYSKLWICSSYGEDCKPTHLDALDNYIVAREEYWSGVNTYCEGSPFKVDAPSLYSPVDLATCQRGCNLSPMCWYADYKATTNTCKLYKHNACKIIHGNSGGHRVYMRLGNHIDCVGAWEPCSWDCPVVTYHQTKKASTIGGKDCSVADGTTKQCNAGDGSCTATSNAQSPTPRPTTSAALIDTLAKLKAWCSESVANCAVCRGKDRDDGTCKVKESKLRKCRKFKGNAVCDRIVGCWSRTTKKGKARCNGKKHGLA